MLVNRFKCANKGLYACICCKLSSALLPCLIFEMEQMDHSQRLAHVLSSVDSSTGMIIISVKSLQHNPFAEIGQVPLARNWHVMQVSCILLAVCWHVMPVSCILLAVCWHLLASIGIVMQVHVKYCLAIKRKNEKFIGIRYLCRITINSRAFEH